MKQINNGFADYYYIFEDGRIKNDKTGNILSPDKKGRYRLLTENNDYKKISVRTLYGLVYGKYFCTDSIKDLDGEHWKEVENTGGLYLVSDKGRVKSLCGLQAALLSLYKNVSGGYFRVDIKQGEKRRGILVHRLVAAAFLPMPPSINYQLHHKDGNKENNSAENLEWLLASEHAKKHNERTE